MKKSGLAKKEDESLSQLVKRIRLEKKMSLSAVQRNSGERISNGYISRIENGFEGANLTVQLIQALAEGLQVPPSMLLEKFFDLDPVIPPACEEIVRHYQAMSPVSQQYLLLLARALRAHSSDNFLEEDLESNVEVKRTKKK